MIKVLQKAFQNLKKQSLPIYGVKSTNLRDFTTKKKDLKKGISRIPLATSIIKEECNCEDSRKDSKKDLLCIEKDNYKKIVDDRYNSMVKENKKLSFIIDDEKDIMGLLDKRERASTLFS